ncbi:helix-turn-helix domain-containing protein [Aminithiophilus ramosus]|uniref:helix-turn-helix domain-containing protein n=1 Tax=Aminithiophilus ramosus TaxID=3029084 RepID=UPI00389923C0
MGVNVRSISRWETNERSVPSDKLADLADVLGTSTDYLLCKTDEPRPVSPATLDAKKKAGLRRDRRSC